MKDKIAEMIVRTVLGLLVGECVLSAVSEITGKFQHTTDMWLIGIFTSVIGTVVASIFRKPKC